MKRIKLFLGLSVMMALGACTVEKRRYTDGYHVEWNRNSGKGVAGKPSDLTAKQETPQVVVVESQLASTATVTEVEPVVIAPTMKSDAAIVAKSDKQEKCNLKQATVAEHSSHGVKAGMIKDFNRGSVQAFQAQPLSSGSETDTILLVILAILLPPLAVYLYEGSWTKRCTVNLILTLLCGLPGVIHALVVILGNK